jgi:hypothetical protein
LLSTFCSKNPRLTALCRQPAAGHFPVPKFLENTVALSSPVSLRLFFVFRTHPPKRKFFKKKKKNLIALFKNKKKKKNLRHVELSIFMQCCS